MCAALRIGYVMHGPDDGLAYGLAYAVQSFESIYQVGCVIRSLHGPVRRSVQQ